MPDVVRILTPVAIFFAGTLYLALMRDIMEEHSFHPLLILPLLNTYFLALSAST